MATVLALLRAQPTADRQPTGRLSGDMVPPVVEAWDFPALSSNLARTSVSVRITDASGIQQATLHYAYGNHVGFVDSRPDVAGGVYTFHIAPAGVAFIGEVSFAVEAVDHSPHANRAMSPWRRLRLVTREEQASSGGVLELLNSGLLFADVPEGGKARVEVSRWLPEGVAPLPQGLAGVGRYFKLQADFASGRISISYPVEETYRLIASTLSLALWDGHIWTRVPSQVNSQRCIVTGEFRRARIWTLAGEDRVLWRAPGRETGPALADLNGDGTLELATVLYQPGELLSSRGEPLVEFPMDSPYRPVKNSSSPVVVRFESKAEPAILFGAPSGYLYAFERSGKRLWRAEVGGEVLGGPSAGPLLAGGALGIAAAWEGGVSVVDPSGRVVWQKELAVPGRSYAVLADLDGDGRAEILVNAGSKIVALRGDTGREVWRFEAPGREFTTPAAGEFVRGGRPRVVFGDAEGSVYAVDGAGRLLWRQDRIYGPREVPEPIEQYAGIAEVGLADLDGRGERQVIVTTKSGETVALSARGERLWRFASYERKVGISLGGGAHLAFADLDGDGRLEVVLSQQDSFLYVLGADGRLKWSYLGSFWYHFPPSIGDLLGNGELDILFTSPEEGGTYALRSGVRGKPGRVPWPTARGGPARTNCASW